MEVCWLLRHLNITFLPVCLCYYDVHRVVARELKNTYLV
jgi:hypothetical protein